MSEPDSVTPEPNSLRVVPIGYVRSARRAKFDAPIQPDSAADEKNDIELVPGRQLELALQDVDGFDRIWLISWFDRNEHWRPRVMPPRGPSTRRGVFATRSPHRPNPLGLTCVSLISVSGLRLTVGPLDLLDGTPILDIKPYLSTVDSFPQSSLGWLETIDSGGNAAPAYSIELTPTAEMQLKWLRDNWGIDFSERAFAILRREPGAHRTRRVLKLADGSFRIACGAWRMFYRVELDVVTVERIEKGYSDETLAAHGPEHIVDGAAQIAFAEWSGC